MNFVDVKNDVALKIANQYNWSKEEMEIYDYMTLKEMDEVNALETAEKKGEKKGVKKSQIQIAKAMVNDNMDIELIMKYSGLSKEEIEELDETNREKKCN